MFAWASRAAAGPTGPERVERAVRAEEAAVAGPVLSPAEIIRNAQLIDQQVREQSKQQRAEIAAHAKSLAKIQSIINGDTPEARARQLKRAREREERRQRRLLKRAARIVRRAGEELARQSQ